MKVTFEEFCNNVVNINIKAIKNSSTKSLFTIVLYKNEDISIHPFLYTDGSPMDYAQQVIDKETPEMYCIVSEAWVKIIPEKESKEYEKNYKWGDIQEDPKKKECLFFLGKTMDGTKTFSRTFLITRKKTEIILKELKDKTGVNTTLKSTKLK